MGFQKGSITLSPTRDIPLLLQVLHSRLITHDQLQEFMLLEHHEVKQACVNFRAKNELTSSGYVKDYDAIVTVRIEDRPLTFALEYERTPKKSRDYLQIRSLLEQENRIDRFLYIVPEPDLGSFIVECFSGTTALLFIGLAGEFTKSFEEMNVIDAASGTMRPIASAL